MNYEQALKLKNAGFPQDNLSERKDSWVDKWESKERIKLDDDFVYIPTLEELIEACGKPFKRLVKKGGTKRHPEVVWHAQAQGVSLEGSFGMTRTKDFHASGPTPLIAVANLYLALNDKKK